MSSESLTHAEHQQLLVECLQCPELRLIFEMHWGIKKELGLDLKNIIFKQME